MNYEIRTIDLEGTKVRMLTMERIEFLETTPQYIDIATGKDLETFVAFDEDDDAVYAVIDLDGHAFIRW